MTYLMLKYHLCKVDNGLEETRVSIKGPVRKLRSLHRQEVTVAWRRTVVRRKRNGWRLKTTWLVEGLSELGGKG